LIAALTVLQLADYTDLFVAKERRLREERDRDKGRNQATYRTLHSFSLARISPANIPDVRNRTRSTDGRPRPRRRFRNTCFPPWRDKGSPGARTSWILFQAY